MLKPKVVTLVLGLVAFGLGGMPAVTGEAWAGNGNGKSNGNGNSSNGKGAEKSASAKEKGGSSNGNGSTASELKGLNSSNANANALENAAPNSRVGKNATYLAAAEQSLALVGTLEEQAALLAQAEAAHLLAMQGVIDAQGALATAQADLQTAVDGGLDTAAAQAAVDLAAANLTAAEEAALLTQANYDAVAATASQAQAAYDAAVLAEQDALLAATGGAALSPEALAQYRANLGL